MVDINLPKIINTNTNGKWQPSLFYNINPSTWYETFPFLFEIREGEKSNLKCKFFLPIPPQNYTIQDMSTAEAHATIGGVVEEVNAPVFSMITLVGTTGMALNSPNLGDGVSADLLTKGRKYIDEVNGSQLAKIVRKITSGALIQGAIADIILPETEDSLQYQEGPSAVNTPTSEAEISKLFSPADNSTTSFLEQFKENFKQNIPKNEFSNGWAWSQALRQFFLIFQRERQANENLSLYFVDHKSRTHYRCVPRSVQFQQNANAPYLINYTIILKCWELKDVQKMSSKAKSVNRFSGDLKEVTSTSITSIVSKVGKTCNTLNRFPSVAGSFVRNSTGSFL